MGTKLHRVVNSIAAHFRCCVLHDFRSWRRSFHCRHSAAPELKLLFCSRICEKLGNWPNAHVENKASTLNELKEEGVREEVIGACWTAILSRVFGCEWLVLQSITHGCT